MILSPQQQTVATWVAQGTGSSIVRARAGTGKTTLLLACMGEMKGRVATVAFNKRIAEEIANKAAKAGHRHVVAGTFHKFGYDAWRLANRGVKIDADAKLKRLLAQVDVPAHFHSFVRSAVSLAKQRGFGAICRFNDPQLWLDLVDHFDLDQQLSEDLTRGFGDREFLIQEALRYSIRVLKAGIVLSAELIDFDDMIYMPLLAGTRFPTYDWLLVDEAQDTNPVRRAMARAMLKPGGRAIFVGDDRQAIYGFTGADNDALDQIARDFGTRDFPLTVTRRCPKSVVALAQGLVSDYEAHDSAPEGEVTSITDADFLADVSGLTKDDAIICRNTAPLVALAFQLIRRSVPCHVEGREIGSGLVKLAARWPRIKNVSALIDKLSDYADAQTARLMTKGKEQQAEALQDQVATLIIIARDLPASATTDDLRARIGTMFQDVPAGQKPDSLTLLTAHRSKGSEFPRVFILGRERFMPSRFARQDWQLAQEANLEYVAITRAQSSLVDILVSE